MFCTQVASWALCSETQDEHAGRDSWPCREAREGGPSYLRARALTVSSLGLFPSREVPSYWLLLQPVKRTRALLEVSTQGHRTSYLWDLGQARVGTVTPVCPFTGEDRVSVCVSGQWVMVLCPSDVTQ